jgi:hypothetical protein
MKKGKRKRKKFGNSKKNAKEYPMYVCIVQYMYICIQYRTVINRVAGYKSAQNFTQVQRTGVKKWKTFLLNNIIFPHPHLSFC